MLELSVKLHGPVRITVVRTADINDEVNDLDEYVSSVTCKGCYLVFYGNEGGERERERERDREREIERETEREHEREREREMGSERVK